MGLSAAEQRRRAYLPVQLRGSWVALVAEVVREILGPRPWVPIPGSTPNVPGVLSWRGVALPLVDLGALMGLGESVRPGVVHRRVVVVEAGGHTLALPVDAVREVMHVEEAAVGPPHATAARFAGAEVEIDRTPMPVLDLSAVVQALVAQEPA